jgi:hypothetical protein
MLESKDHQRALRRLPDRQSAVEETVKPMLGYLGLLLACLLIIAFVPAISSCSPDSWVIEPGK